MIVDESIDTCVEDANYLLDAVHAVWKSRNA